MESPEIPRGGDGATWDSSNDDQSRVLILQERKLQSHAEEACTDCRGCHVCDNYSSTVQVPVLVHPPTISFFGRLCSSVLK